MCVCVFMYMRVCSHVHVGTCRVEKGASDTLELEWQGAMSHLLWILGIGLWTVEAANAPSHCANSPGPTVIFNYIIYLILVFSFSHKGSNQCKNLEICTFLQSNKFLA